MAQNTKTINKGINNGSRNGSETATSMIPTKAKQPTITRPTPAKTKAKSIATQKSITAVNIIPHKPTAVPRGPVILRPFMLTDTFVVTPSNDHTRNTIINIAKIKASFFTVLRPFRNYHWLFSPGVIVLNQ
jgi:hypothetical protein